MPILPLSAASSAGTSLVAHLEHISITLATWDAVWEVYLDPKWAQQRLRLYGAQDRALEHFFKKFEEDMAEVSMERHGRAKQLVVYFGAAGIGTGAASSAGTSLVAHLEHISITLATWDAVWEVYLDPKWAQQRLRLYGAQDRALEHFFKKFEEDMAEVSMERHGRAKQLVVYFGAAGIGTGEQGKLPAKGKEYPGLGYKRLRDKPPKTQPAVAQ
ncbi:uncharacterized protein HaLaN_19429 [Haematococcus lacustris]|uniref:Uncharacterized protein n=1 Tax=Haematococcus lacustris TaxID=44745 RepID=A0A699ZQT5_HAELA|nr:uncharacterized protein HaLaN_19429 [Haematococcus lacustris]